MPGWHGPGVSSHEIHPARPDSDQRSRCRARARGHHYGRNTIGICRARHGASRIALPPGRRHDPGGRLSDRGRGEPETDTAYVVNNGTMTVSVISGRTNTVVASIRVGQAPQGVAVNPKTDTVYVANGDNNTVSVINGRTDTAVARIRVGRIPDGVATDPKSDTTYVANADDFTVSVIAPCRK